MLARMSAAFFATSSRALAPSSAASRCRVNLSILGSLVSSDTRAPIQLAPKGYVVHVSQNGTSGTPKRGGRRRVTVGDTPRHRN